MFENVLIKDGEKYEGLYVAMRSFTDKRIICSGDDIAKVFTKAQNQGCEQPVVLYVPKEGMTNIY
jgi:hypothetical protein